MPWTTDVVLRGEWVDYNGHITATAHLAILEEAHTQWLAEVMDMCEPSFVVASQGLEYRAELLEAAGTVCVSLVPKKLTSRSVHLYEEIRSSEGTLHTESRVVLVRWDGATRGSTPFLEPERERIEDEMRRAQAQEAREATGPQPFGNDPAPLMQPGRFSPAPPVAR